MWSGTYADQAIESLAHLKPEGKAELFKTQKEPPGFPTTLEKSIPFEVLSA